MATAAATAASLDEIFRARHAAVLNRARDILADFLLQSFQVALSAQEIACDLIGKQRIASTFEFTDFNCAEFDSGMLLVVQFFTPLVDALILQAGCIVRQEALDFRLELQKRWIAHDLGAQLLGLYDHGGVFGNEGRMFCNNGHDRSIPLLTQTGNGHFWEISPIRSAARVEQKRDSGAA
jgi:hypothetical protein